MVRNEWENNSIRANKKYATTTKQNDFNNNAANVRWQQLSETCQAKSSKRIVVLVVIVAMLFVFVYQTKLIAFTVATIVVNCDLPYLLQRCIEN